jgi:peroxiredoxin
VERNVSLAAISTDDIEDARNMAELSGAGFPILSDEEGGVARDYGVFSLLNDGVAAPSAFIITPERRIVWRFVGESPSDRAAVEEILAQVDEVVR